jgi:hypothetical protein
MQALNRRAFVDFADVVVPAVLVDSLATDGFDESPQPAATNVAKTIAAAEATSFGWRDTTRTSSSSDP